MSDARSEHSTDDALRTVGAAPRRRSRRRAPRSRPTLSLAAGAVLAVAALAAYFLWPSSPRQSTSSGAPSSVTVPQGLSRPGLQSNGVSADGWLEQDSSVTLAGGSAGQLTLRAQVPSMQGQHLQVLVNGQQVASQAVPAGTLSLRAPILASRTDRRIELRFARTITLKPPDNRKAAAQLAFVGVGPEPVAPRSLTLPGDLSNVITSGLYADGWATTRADVVLAGGARAGLVLRGLVPVKGQRLDVYVNGLRVVSDAVAPGRLSLDVPLPSSPGNRHVALRFSTAIRLKAPDTRVASALLTHVGVAPLRGPAIVRIPSALAHARVAYSGIYLDGWAQKDVRLVVAGGGTATLAVTALTPLKGQSVRVLVDAHPAASLDLAPGLQTIRLPVAATAAPRVVELQFARVAPIAANDPRPAATLLERVAVVEIAGAPATVQIPADLTTTLSYSGIYQDGWAQKDVRVVVAGGPASKLFVTALTPRTGRRVQILVDGRPAGTRVLPPGKGTVHVHVVASKGPRLVELRFAGTAPIAANDPRPAATLLRTVAVGSSAAPVASAAPQSSGRMTLSAALTAAQEVPRLTGSGTGTFTATLAGKALHWQLSVANMTGPLVAAVIHTGSAGQVGPFLVRLCEPCSDTDAGSAQLTSAEAAQLRGGAAYVNVGTSANPTGEIRGQLTAR